MRHNAETPKFLIELGATDSQQLCSVQFDSAGFFESTQNLLPFGSRYRLAQGAHDTGTRTGGRSRPDPENTVNLRQIGKVSAGEVAVVGAGDGLFQEVAQFAYVAGPGVSGKSFQAVGGQRARGVSPPCSAICSSSISHSMGMSWRRSRSGGRRMGRTLRR
jgi:hypothetical protein